MVRIKDLKILKYHIIICSKWENKDKKVFKEEKLVEILQILGLIENTCLLSKNGWNKCKPEI